jgi:Txe/YoeB family toxin of Txe-Axe toxin-antitoxin module
MRPTPLYNIGATIRPWKGVFEVERWKGEMVERFPRNKNHQAIYRVIPGKLA